MSIFAPALRAIKLGLLGAVATAAHAQPLDWSLRIASFEQPQQTDPLAAEPPDIDPLEIEPIEPAEIKLPIDYGLKGGSWLTLGAGGATNFLEDTDRYAFVQYSKFIADDFEWAVELGGWGLETGEDITAGVSVSSIFRWHFYRDDRWTTFADVGIGALLAGDNVPDDGTSFNFLPRAGAGVTYRLGDSRARLMGGLRWHHISNARILGNDDNPGRDSAMLYLGVSVPF